MSKTKQNNFRNYNIVKKSIISYFKQNKTKYTSKELNSNTKKFYSELKKSFTTNAKGKKKINGKFKRVQKFDKVGFSHSLNAVDYLVELHFAPTANIYSKFNVIDDWWLLQNDVSDLGQMMTIVVDISDVTGNNSSNYIGEASGLNASEINRSVNAELRNKEYARWVKFLFRSDKLEKEFMFYYLVKDTSQHSEILNYNEQEFMNWVMENDVIEFDFIYNSILNKTKKADSILRDRKEAISIIKKKEREIRKELGAPKKKPKRKRVTKEQRKIKAMNKELKLIKEYKALGLTNAQIKKRLLKM